MTSTSSDGNQDFSIESIPILLSLFQGYSTLDGKSRNTALRGTSGDGNQADPRFGIHSNEISVNVDIEQFAQKLYISQSVSASYFGNSLSGKLSYLQDVKRSTYSVSLCIRAFRVVSAKFATDTYFREDLPIPVPAANAEADEFFMYYGDSYVSELVMGGEYTAVFTFYCSSYEMQREIEAEVRASVTKGLAEYNSETQASLNSYLRQVKVDWRFKQDLVGIQNVELPSQDEAIDFALKFHGLTLDAPSVLYFTTTGYEHVPGIGKGFDAIKLNRRYFVGNSIVDGLAASLASIDEAIQQIDVIEGINDFYGFSDPALASNRVVAEQDQSAIKVQMQQYLDCPTASFEALNLPSLANGSPSLACGEKLFSPAWGGSGGGAFDDVAKISPPDNNCSYGSYFHLKTRILFVDIKSGQRVDRLMTQYGCINPDLSKSDLQLFYCQHGATGGSHRGPVYLVDGETLLSIEGRSGEKLDKVLMKFGGNKVLEGGKDGGTPFGPWQPPLREGELPIVLGFYGRAGEEIDRIGLVYSYLKPAKWLPIS
ncbi:MAG: jacalin-like lectin [Synechococcaceae cyanobacterium]|jgi:hypothetical protein